MGGRNEEEDFTTLEDLKKVLVGKSQTFISLMILFILFYNIKALVCDLLTWQLNESWPLDWSSTFYPTPTPDKVADMVADMVADKVVRKVVDMVAGPDD